MLEHLDHYYQAKIFFLPWIARSISNVYTLVSTTSKKAMFQLK